MEQSAEFTKKLEFWTDMDVTAFPKKEYGNYRLDIAQKDINKGKAVKQLVTLLKPEYGYICIGNGYNDLSMFEVAIKDDMVAAIMSNSSYELKKQLKEYCKDIRKGKVLVIPSDKNLANKYILRYAKQFQTYMINSRKVSSSKQRFPFVQRAKINKIDMDNNKSIRNIYRDPNR